MTAGQGIGISKDTVHQLLGHLEDYFLVRTVWIDAASERQRMVNPRKGYPVDPGLIPVFDRTPGEPMWIMRSRRPSWWSWSVAA